MAQTSDDFKNSDVRHISDNFSKYSKSNRTFHSTDYSQDIRNSRVSKIFEYDAGEPVDMFWVDKHHKNGPEIHIILDNGMIDCYNEGTKKYITSLISRPNQIERYYSRTGTPMSTEVSDIAIPKAEKYLEMGWNQDITPMGEYINHMRLNSFKDDSFLNQFVVKLKSMVASTEGVNATNAWAPLMEHYDCLPFYKLLHYSNWVDGQNMNKREKQKFVNNFIRISEIRPEDGKYPNAMKIYDNISKVVDNIKEYDALTLYQRDLSDIQADLAAKDLDSVINTDKFFER